MLLGLEEDEKKFREAMSAAGADMGLVKSWLKVFSKTRKNAFNTATRYYSVKEKLESLLQKLENLEQILINGTGSRQSEKTTVALYVKEFKKLQGSFNDEFIISKADKDFQTTLESVTKLANDYGSSGSNDLILQSEVENLIYLAKEGLDREKPDMFALAYFYLDHNNEDFADLPFPGKIAKVNKLFQDEFIEQIKPTLVSCVKMAEALNDRYEGSLDKKTQRLLCDLAPLLNKEDLKLNPEKRADNILKRMCTV